MKDLQVRFNCEEEEEFCKDIYKTLNFLYVALMPDKEKLEKEYFTHMIFMTGLIRMGSMIDNLTIPKQVMEDLKKKYKKKMGVPGSDKKYIKREDMPEDLRRMFDDIEKEIKERKKNGGKSSTSN